MSGPSRPPNFTGNNTKVRHAPAKQHISSRTASPIIAGIYAAGRPLPTGAVPQTRRRAQDDSHAQDRTTKNLNLLDCSRRREREAHFLANQRVSCEAHFRKNRELL